MTDNIFEIETTALAHIACAPRESSILQTDSAAAYPCVNHSWIFHVLEKQNCLSSSAISYAESTTRAPRKWNLQERPEDSSSWPRAWNKAVLRAASSLRWLSTRSSVRLQDSIIPRNPAGLDFLQPAQCEYADLVAAPFFSGDWMTALAPTFQTVDQ